MEVRWISKRCKEDKELMKSRTCFSGRDTAFWSVARFCLDAAMDVLMYARYGESWARRERREPRRVFVG
jgi:hypothetical protein